MEAEKMAKKIINGLLGQHKGIKTASAPKTVKPAATTKPTAPKPAASRTTAKTRSGPASFRASSSQRIASDHGGVQKLGKGYNFKVYFDNDLIPFSSVSGIEQEREMQTISEGGQNGKEYKLKNKKVPPKTLVLERAFPLKPTNKTMITMDRVIKEGVSIYLLDDRGAVRWGYHFTDCVINKISLGGLDASQSNVLMQRIEVKFENMTED